VLDVLRNLQPQQLVDAVVIADRIGAPAIVKQAMLDLTCAVSAETVTVVVEALSVLPAWPACLQPVLLPVLQHAKLLELPAAEVSKVQYMLLAVLGDLEAVWADNQQKRLLLQLSLPAIELLLSSDQLQVAAEDTVLYTAYQYIAAQRTRDQQSAAKAALAATLRAPPLSLANVAGQTNSNAVYRLLSGYSEQMTVLHSLKKAARVSAMQRSALEQIAAVPAAWLSTRRFVPSSDGVQLVWRLPIWELAQACRDSFTTGAPIVEFSPSHSPPLCGASWVIELSCTQQERDGVNGTAVGLYVHQNMNPDGVRLVFSCTRTSGGTCHCMSRCRSVTGLQTSSAWNSWWVVVVGMRQRGLLRACQQAESLR
jgi:hypothetical protein